ncbi:MAG: hypothetical protein WDZ29_07055 [Balneolaceae bacterium]
MKQWHWILLGILLLASLILEFTVLAGYDSHWWNSVPAFYAIWGFLSCIGIIYVAKFIGKKILIRDIDYYDH